MLIFNTRRNKHRKLLYSRIVEIRSEMVTISLKISLQHPVQDKENLNRLVELLSTKGKLFRKYSRRNALINF